MRWRRERRRVVGEEGGRRKKRHRIDWFGEGRTEKGSEKGRARARMGDKKKESWIKERKTLKGFRRKRGDLAEVRQTLDGYVGEVRDDLGAIRLSFGHHCCKNTRRTTLSLFNDKNFPFFASLKRLLSRLPKMLNDEDGVYCFQSSLSGIPFIGKLAVTYNGASYPTFVVVNFEIMWVYLVKNAVRLNLQYGLTIRYASTRDSIKLNVC